MKRVGRTLLSALLLFGLLGGEGHADSARAGDGCEIATHEMAIDDGTLQYNTVGAGRQVLLLHGLFADKEQWSGMMCVLSGAGYALIAPDLPGYGKSSGFRIQDYKLENQVELLRRLVSTLGIDTVDIAGNSMGGTIAALYTQAHRRQVRSLAFIGSPLGIIEWNEPVKDAIFQGINPFIPIDIPQFDLELSLLFVHPPSLPDSVKAAAVKEYVENNRHYQQVWDIVNLYDNAIHRGMIARMPTLILWGEQDSIFGVEGAPRLRNFIPSSTLVRLPDAGHMLHVENADAAAAIYLKFLARLPR